MRIVRLALIVASCLSVVACGQRQTLAPEEVIRRSVVAGRLLDSASLAGGGSYTLTGSRSASGSFALQGIIRSGSAWSCRLDVARASSAGGAERSISASLLALSLGTGVVYVRIDALRASQDDGEPASLSGAHVGSWLQLDAPELQQPSGAVTTPDPGWIGTIVRAMTVQEDLGFDDTAHSAQRQYHYRVMVHPEALAPMNAAASAGRTGARSGELRPVTVTGEVWIDADTFYLTKAIWHVKALNIGSSAVEGTFMVTLSDFNKAPDIPHAPSSGSTIPAAILGRLFF